MKQLLILFLGAILGISQAQALPITYTAVLDGPSESPPVPSPGIGFATVTLDVVAHTLAVSSNFSGLIGSTTAAHIHCCTAVPGAGVANVATQVPSFLGFPLGVTAGTFANVFDLTLSSSFRPQFITDNGGTVAGAEAALAAGLAAGQAYFNIHTSAFGSGEIRGFLAAVPEIDDASGTAAIALLGGFLAVANERHRRRDRIAPTTR